MTGNRVQYLADICAALEDEILPAGVLYVLLLGSGPHSPSCISNMDRLEAVRLMRASADTTERENPSDN